MCIRDSSHFFYYFFPPSLLFVRDTTIFQDLSAGLGAGRGRGVPLGAGRGGGGAPGGAAGASADNAPTGQFDEFNGGDAGIFGGGGGEYDEDDKEADEIWASIDDHMDSRRRDQREARLKQELDQYRKNNPKITEQFADLKRKLDQVTYEVRRERELGTEHRTSRKQTNVQTNERASEREFISSF